MDNSQGAGQVRIVYEQIPKYARDSMARMILRMTEELFKDPATAAEFEAWKRARGPRDSLR